MQVLNLSMAYLMVLPLVQCNLECYDCELERILKEACWSISKYCLGISYSVMRSSTTSPH